MKYIEKDILSAEAAAYKAELCKSQLDEESLKDPMIHQGATGSNIYQLVSSMQPFFNNLKARMYAEQGGICCYCGQKLEYPNHPYQAQYIVEHVYPKEKDRTIAGEYKNLLLSCRPTDEEEADRQKVSKSQRKKFFHCDKSKESEVLTYTPLQPDCGQHFEYDEFGGIKGTDTDAQKDIEILNLNCEWLKKRREAAIIGELYDDNNNLLSDEELRQRQNTVMERDSNNLHSEFCFAIEGAIKHLLT